MLNRKTQWVNIVVIKTNNYIKEKKKVEDDAAWISSIYKWSRLRRIQRYN